MNEQVAERYPLTWPVGWKRTPRYERQPGTFRTGGSMRQADAVDGQPAKALSPRRLSVADAIKRLAGELGRLGVTGELLSTNLNVRLDGLPRSGQAEPTDPGAAVYFRLKGQPRCLACDRWQRVADNIAAIAQHIDALRRIDRYGVGTMEQAFAGYAALPPTGADWWIVLNIPRASGWSVVESAFKELSRSAHPDRGGRHEDMAKLNAAREAARKELLNG